MSTIHLNPRSLESQTFERLVEFQKSALKSVKDLAGEIGLFVTSPLFFAARLVILVLARTMYKTAFKMHKAVEKDISCLEERQLIEFHLVIKRITSEMSNDSRKMEKLVNATFPKGQIRRRVLDYLFASVHIMTVLDKTLRKAAYPDADKPLTQAQLEAKAGKFAKFDDDWQSSEYDVYEKSYAG